MSKFEGLENASANNAAVVAVDVRCVRNAPRRVWGRLLSSVVALDAGLCTTPALSTFNRIFPFASTICKRSIAFAGEPVVLGPKALAQPVPLKPPSIAKFVAAMINHS